MSGASRGDRGLEQGALQEPSVVVSPRPSKLRKNLSSCFSLIKEGPPFRGAQLHAVGSTLACSLAPTAAATTTAERAATHNLLVFCCNEETFKRGPPECLRVKAAAAAAAAVAALGSQFTGHHLLHSSVLKDRDSRRCRMWLASRPGLRGLGVLPSRRLSTTATWASSSHVAEAAAAAGAAADAAAAVRSAAYRGGTAKALIPLKWALATTSRVPTHHTLQEQQRQVPSFRLVLRSKTSHAAACATFSLLGKSEGPSGAPQASTPEAPQASTLGAPQASTPGGPQASTRAARRQLGSAWFEGALPARLGPLYRSMSRSYSSSRVKRVDAPSYWEASMKPSFPSSNQRLSKQQPLPREQQWQQADFDRVVAGDRSRGTMPPWSWMLLLGVSGTAVVCWLSERRRRIEAEAATAAAQAAAAAAAERSALGWFWPDWASLGGSMGSSSATSSRRSEVSSPSGFPGHVWWTWETPRSPEAFNLIAFSSDFLPLQPHEPACGPRQRQRQTTDTNPWRSSAAAAEMLLGLNALIFVAWRVAAIASRSPGGGRLLQLLMHHFLASREAMRAKRFHTLLTATFPHILMNWMLLQLLLQQLQPMLSGPEVWALWGLSSLMGVVAHMSVSSLPVLGASSFACCLLWVEGVCRSRDLFMTILPVPGVMLTALQLSQLNLLVNGGLYLLSRFGKGRVARALQGVSWVGHLGGIAAGCLFAAYKRHVAHDKNWGSFTNLSRTFSAADWRNTRAALSFGTVIKRQQLKQAKETAAAVAAATVPASAMATTRDLLDAACDCMQFVVLIIKATDSVGFKACAGAAFAALQFGERTNLPVLQMKLEQLRRKRQLRRAFET
ncbi:hypothetical protein Emed_004622 [Eimeria media]